ncbi:dihydrodipicolinate synthase family protein [Bacillus subtilis]|uniref:dihydrodipicolinate synthase family protein n=1 Tax=Bacillus subtilis TaxID=1423 RepID=UPI002ADEAE51|nr:dihydrodipicolinate synthase family protein [Bacillus subtilis]MEA1024817.1 dihydrodipicolinate synthase family protein [Bacillus subtilis]MED3515602.1 dihydrodipicolinate synthase family protein [Bacillus subtilis]MED3519773.1 dihydrodipicolinate synthase family protein [Bacillus subtilis]
MKNLNVAIPTPFNEDESLFLEGFDTIVDHLKNNGINSLLICGTTGEQHSLSIDERIQIIEYFSQRKSDDIELMFGVSATRTSDAIKLIEKIEKTHIHSILIGFPPYIRPTQKQAIYYVDELLSHTSKEVALYNNPTRTGFNLSEKALNDLLSRHSNIRGLKEGGDVHRHKQTDFPNNFIMFAAGDVNLPEMIKNGCNGLSSLVGNVYPDEIKVMFNDLLENKHVDLNRLNELINEVINDHTLINIKTHYKNIGLKIGDCRSPIIKM